MWQVAVAAAVAGSSLLAQRFFAPTADSIISYQSTRTELCQQSQSSDNFINAQLSSPSSPSTPQIQKNYFDSAGANNHLEETRSIAEEKDRIFRFSSSGSGSRSTFWLGSKKFRVLGKKVGRVKKKMGGFDGETGDQGGKRLCVCLKRRKTSRNNRVRGNRDSCSSEESSSFDWGLGLGMMYMMSSGRAEISKLNNNMDETAKVLQELKSELYKRKSVQQHLSRSVTYDTEIQKDEQKQVNKQDNVELIKLKKGANDVKICSPLGSDGEYASSVLTEEAQPRGTEMDQLEAEFEFELQKLPWCTNEAPYDGGNKADYKEVEAFHEPDYQSSSCFPFCGVSPSTLNQKLSRVLIKQQEGQILELEAELNLAYSKLQEKEAELQALKDCVRSLTKISISSISDEKTQAFGKQGSIMQCDHIEKTGPETRVLGTKRAMNIEPCNYELNQ
ncbi:hypothetical protein Ancab_031981 [Ancistrocladus abbreviatus]